MVAEMTQLTYAKITLKVILPFQKKLFACKLNRCISYFLVKNSKCEHKGHEGCCFHILTCYGYVHEGYASYGFCFNNNEKYPSCKLTEFESFNVLKISVISIQSLLTSIDGVLKIPNN